MGENKSLQGTLLLRIFAPLFQYNIQMHCFPINSKKHDRPWILRKINEICYINYKIHLIKMLSFILWIDSTSTSFQIMYFIASVFYTLHASDWVLKVGSYCTEWFACSHLIFIGIFQGWFHPPLWRQCSKVFETRDLGWISWSTTH